MKIRNKYLNAIWKILKPAVINNAETLYYDRFTKRFFFFSPNSNISVTPFRMGIDRVLKEWIQRDLRMPAVTALRINLTGQH